MAQSKLMTKAIWGVVYYLVDEGIKIIEKARSTKETDNITGTQYDSYGLAVFFNGKLYYSLKSSDPSKDLTSVKRSIETLWDEDAGRHKGWKKGGVPAGYGREWAALFVKEIKSSGVIPKSGFALIVFNAAFYSSVQEHGDDPNSKLKRKYRIISQIVGDMQDLKSKFSGADLIGLNIKI